MQNGHRVHPVVRSAAAATAWHDAAGRRAVSATTNDGRASPPVGQSQRGFSLVEVMVAIVLTVIAFLAIMDACIRLQALQRLDSELSHVYRTCRTNLDEMRTMTLAKVRDLDGAGFVVVGSNGTTPILTPVPGDADGMPGRIEVREERTAGGRALYRIETSVEWVGATGRHAVAFTTMWGGVP